MILQGNMKILSRDKNEGGAKAITEEGCIFSGEGVADFGQGGGCPPPPTPLPLSTCDLR